MAAKQQSILFTKASVAADVPHATSVASGVLCVIACTASMIALVVPWWSGPDAADITIDGTETPGEINTGSEIGLWDFRREFDYDEVAQTKEMSWDDACETIERDVKGGDVTCLNIRTIRGLCIVAGLLFLITGGLMFAAFAMQPLAQLIAAMIGGMGVTCGTIGCMLAVTMSTKGIGFGCGMSVFASMLGTVGVAFAIYGGQRAIRDMDPGASHFESKSGTRQERMQQKMDEAALGHAALASMEKGLRVTASPNDAASKSSRSSGDHITAKIHPATLEQIIYWNSKDDDDEDAEIPTDLLVKAFREIDEDCSGAIELEELVSALQLCGLNANMAATERLMKEIDKNASGDVDIHEFVEFFRTVEDMNKFQKRAQQRAKFFSTLMNTCFICDIFVVCALLMVFIRMENKTGDDYKILRSVLLVASFLLASLFFCVIAFPALRLIISPSAAAWSRAQQAAPPKKRKKVPSADDNIPKDVPWKAANPEGTPPPPPVAQMGGSYRLKKVQAVMNAPSTQQPSMMQPSAPPVDHLTMLPNEINDEQLAYGYPPSNVSEAEGFVQDDAGQIVRYNPTAFLEARQAQEQYKKRLLSFSTMQVRDLQVTREEARDVHAPPPMAITYQAY